MLLYTYRKIPDKGKNVKRKKRYNSAAMLMSTIRHLRFSGWLGWVLVLSISFIITPSNYVGYAEATVREAHVAGQFYPAAQAELSEVIGQCLQGAESAIGEGKPRILLVPHAGYPYSGPVAGKGFGHLKGNQYDGVVIVAFTHQFSFPGISVDQREVYQTPLGEVPVHQEAVARLLSHAGVRFIEEAHEAPEHSLEVELPFIQTMLPGTPIVPVLLGEASDSVAIQLADALADLARQGDFLFVFSTDLSHYHADAEARAIDARTVDAILYETPQAVSRLFESGRLEACGRGPILTSLYLAERLGYPTRALLGYANSGDTAGDKSRVVGYASIAMYEPLASQPGGISREAGDELVRVARNTLERAIGGHSDLPAIVASHPDAATAAGVFVTLRTQGVLRGCIGRIQTNEPLSETVPVVARDAALRDHRFLPVTADELDRLDVEVSVLTAPARLLDWHELVPGRDGVMLEYEGHSGVFLPQVWHETGWTRVEFLRELASQKAGLPPDAWQQADLYTFQDQAFTESR